MTRLAEILTLTRTAQRQLAELRSLRRSNPNHVPSGPHGGEFASGPGGKGHGKHSAKRRKRRLKRLERLRREGHKEIAELKARHKADRKELVRDQRKDWADSRKGQRKEWVEHTRDKKLARKELLAEHAAERKSLAKEHAKEHVELAKEHAAEIKHWDVPDELPALKAEHAEAVRVLHAEHAEAVREQKREHNQAIRDHKESEAKAKADLKEEHRGQRESWLEDYRTDRQSMRESQREERRETIERLKSELWDEFPKSKSGRPRTERTLGGGLRGGDEDAVRASDSLRGKIQGGWRGFDPQTDGRTRRIRQDRPAQAGRFSGRKTDKASSAHAILFGCLKRRGWTKAWREGRLTGRQQLQLLEDVRQYGRAWLRHEAQGFFEAYGIEAHGIQTQSAIRSGPAEILAGESGPSGLGNPGLHQEDSGCSFNHGGGERGHRSSGRDADGNQDGRVTDEATQGQVGQNRSADNQLRTVLQGRETMERDLERSRSLSGRLLSPLRRFFDRARAFVHELIFAGTMALKGTEPLSTAEVASLDQAAKVQAEYLANFEREVIASSPVALVDPADLQHSTIIAPPPMTEGQFVARAELYANAAHQAAQNVARQTVVGAGIQRFERIVLGRPRTEHCFPAGTLVETDCGPRPIESIKVGDRVLTRFGFRKVLRLFTSTTDQLIRISANGRSVDSTPNHPFLTQRGWVRADELTILDQPMLFEEIPDKIDLGITFPDTNNLESASNQVSVPRCVSFVLSQLLSIERFKPGMPVPPVSVGLDNRVAHDEIDDEIPVFNLEVDEVHEYIANGFVVHNCNECPPDAALGWVPIGTLRPIGARECEGRCLCHFEYTDNPGGATTVNGSPRPPRKPRPVRPKPITPTHAEIKAEVDKFLAGKPSKLVVGDITPRVVEPIPATPAPEGYVHVEAEYDADGNLIYKEVD